MPVQGPIHIDRPLTNISIGYRSEGLIADDLFPNVPVGKESDSYYQFDKANSMRNPQTLRANGAEANEDNISLSTSSYRLEEHALKEIITKRDRELADPGVNLEVSTVEDLTGKILRHKERDAAGIVFTDGNWANETSLSATLAWSANTTLSNPILNADSAASVIITQAGVRPNVCVLDLRTFNAAKEHTSIVDRIKYTSSDSVTEGLLAKLFNVKKLFVAYGTENTAQENLAASMSLIWTDSAWFGYVEYAPGLKRPSALYNFRNGAGVQVKRYMDEPRNGEWFEVAHMYDQRADMASDCGYLIVNTVQ